MRSKEEESLSQEIRRARLREIAQSYQTQIHHEHICLMCLKTTEECDCTVSPGKIVPIAYKRVKEGLGAVRD
jgi:hypothetical protein